jgi:nickel/cobalt transporter (NicO) family protein
MYTLLVGSATLSFFHALIPSHWLPVLAVSRQLEWSKAKTLRITFVVGMAHVLSTVLLGLGIAAFGIQLEHWMHAFTHVFSPVLLCLLGAYYLYQHYYHHHFHLHEQPTQWGVVVSLAVSMFFSPCLEIEGYFLAAGPFGWPFVLQIAALYCLTSVVGMMVWMTLAINGLKKLDWHAWEHNAGLITGIMLIISGLSLFVFH